VNIWVDADACPGVIKEILFRAAERELMANQTEGRGLADPEQSARVERRELHSGARPEALGENLRRGVVVARSQRPHQRALP